MTDVDHIDIYDESGVNSMSSNQTRNNDHQLITVQQTGVDDEGLHRTEPIIVRGDGNLTIFGIFNRFSTEFPSKLCAKLAPEEYKDCINKINLILKKELSNNLKWFLFGSLCCCCTLGCSFIPVIYMNKKAKLSINKLLTLENERLFKKLGLKWSMTKIKCNNNALAEFVIRIDVLDKVHLYNPD
jgi:hypothetical protein